jgi:methyl-accepting chemotaxis protein
MSSSPLRGHRRLLLHLLLASSGAALVFVAVLAAAAFVPLIVKMQSGDASPDETVLVANRILTLHARFWPVVVASFVAVCASATFLASRMTDPLVRFVRVFRSLEDRVLPQAIQLRRRDYLTAEAERLNQMLASLEGWLHEVQGRGAAVHEAIADLTEHALATDADDFAERLNALQGLDKSLQEALVSFRKASSQGPRSE